MVALPQRMLFVGQLRPGSTSLHRAEAARRFDGCDDFVTTALVVRGRAEVARRRRFHLDTIEIGVEGEVKIDAALLAIGDDI